MAMRIYSAADFEAELKKMGLQPTDYRSKHIRVWVTADGHQRSVPDFRPNGRYPDWILDDILSFVKLQVRPRTPKC